MTRSAADFLAPPSQRIVVVQDLAQLQQMSVSELPEGSLISLTRHFYGAVDNGVGAFFKFTRFAPSVGSLVFDNVNLVNANGDGFFYQYPQRGKVTLVNGALVVTSVWLGGTPNGNGDSIVLNYIGTLVNPGFLSTGTVADVSFQITSSSGTDGSNVQWHLFI